MAVGFVKVAALGASGTCAAAEAAGARALSVWAWDPWNRGLELLL